MICILPALRTPLLALRSDASLRRIAKFLALPVPASPRSHGL